MIVSAQVGHAVFALMCVQTNRAGGDGVKLDYWSRMNPAVKNQYHGWARTVLAALIQGDKEES